jgi:hypothetical protein
MGINDNKLGPGARVDSTNSDGSVNVVKPDGSTTRFDTYGFLKASNKDPNSVNIQYNTAATAKDENDLDFTDQMKFIMAKTPKQQLGLLQRQYGESNVMQDPQSGEFRVKGKDGFWKKAESRWYNELAASAPNIAAAIPGTMAGASMGSVLGPIGAIAGGILGGAVSKGLEKYGEQKFAEMAGIRTEQDLAETASEVGNDFANNLIWDTLTAGGGKVLNVLGRNAKLKFAEVLGSMVHGTKAADWLTVMFSGEAASTIRSMVKGDIQAKAANVAGEALPTTKRLANIISSQVRTAKNAAENQYGLNLAVLDDSGALKSAGKSISTLRESMADSLQKLGLIDLTNMNRSIIKKTEQELLRDSAIPEKQGIEKLLGLMDKVDQMDKLQKSGQPISAKDFMDLKKRFSNDIRALSSSIDPAQRSTMAVRVLSQNADAAEAVLNQSLRDSGKIIRGMPADVFYNKMNHDYARYTQAYDVFANKIKDFSDIGEIRKVAGKMTTEDGHAFVEAFKELGTVTGNKEVIASLQDIQRNVAARNIASESGGQGMMGVAKTVLGATGRNISGGVANVTEFASGIKRGLDHRVVKQALAPVRAVATGANFLRRLQPNERVRFLTDTNMVSQFLQSITSYAPMKQDAEQQLMQQVP